MKYTTLILMLIAFIAVGCTRHRPKADQSPFQDEETQYTLAFVFDLGPKYRDRVIYGDTSALKYAMDVKDTYFRDRSEPTDRLLIAQIVGTERAVLWDGMPRTFKREFPNAAADLRDYLRRQFNKTSGPHLQTYDSVASTFDYLMKHRSRKGKTATLVFSEMKDQSPDPKKARKHLVDSLAAYHKGGGHCAFYWLSDETSKELDAIGDDAGLTFKNFIPDAVRDPVRPTFLD